MELVDAFHFFPVNEREALIPISEFDCVTKFHGVWTHVGGMLPIFMIPQIFMF